MKRHKVLFVDDELSNRIMVTQYLDVYGIDCVAVSSLEEARPLIATGDFCLLLFDMGIFPTKNATKPELSLGYVLVECARETFPRRNEAAQIYYVPILLMSAHADFDVLYKVRYRIDDFVKKPPTNLNEAVFGALRASGREDHANCAAITALARQRGSSAPPASGLAETVVTGGGAQVRIVLTGEVKKRNKNGILANGRPLDLAHLPFFILLKLHEGRELGIEPVSKSALGAKDGDGFRGMHELQKVVGPYVNEVKVYKSIRGNGYALADEVVVEVRDLGALEGHYERSVQLVAAGLRKKDAKARRK